MAEGARFTPYRSPNDSVSRRTRYERIRDALWAERSPHDAHFRDLGEYVCPRRPRFVTNDRNKGDRRNQKIIDSTAVFAKRVLQSGMHAGMTSPARPWMRLATPDPDLNEYASVKDWLFVTTQRLLAIFAQCNLYNSLPTHYGDMGVFATAATAVLDDDQDLFRTYNYPIGSYAMATDHRGLVNQWVYECEKTVLEIVEMFLWNRRTGMIDWRNASNTLRNLWERQSYHQKVPICWMVTPNMERDEGKLSAAKAMPYYSVHIEKGQDKDNTFLRESGFNEFPVLVSRWDVTADDWWGTDSPGMVALGDIKQLQTGERRGAQAVEKMLNPPLQAPVHIRNQKASLLPGDITYIDLREGQKGIHPIHDMNFAIDQHELKQQNCRMRVQRAFYEDLFLMLAYSDQTRGVQPPTATEIAERHEEKLIALGPVLERTNDELLDRLVDRTFAMADRVGLIPPAPPELRGVALKVEYTSIMSAAQKLVGVVAHERFLQTASALVAIQPAVAHKVNWFQAIDDAADMLGVNPRLVVPDDEAAESAAAAAEQQQAATQATALKDVTGAAANLSNASLADDNALKRIVEGVSP
jgi:hypothetical protein